MTLVYSLLLTGALGSLLLFCVATKPWSWKSLFPQVPMLAAWIELPLFFFCCGVVWINRRYSKEVSRRKMTAASVVFLTYGILDYLISMSGNTEEQNLVFIFSPARQLFVGAVLLLTLVFRSRRSSRRRETH